jgi:hypothetical protein
VTNRLAKRGHGRYAHRRYRRHAYWEPFRSTCRIFIGTTFTGAGSPGSGSDSAQIQFWKIIKRLKVAIDIPTKAAEIGSIAAKPMAPAATKPQSKKRGVGLRVSA